MTETGTPWLVPFGFVVVKSLDRVFRDHPGLEFSVRKRARNSVRLVAITQITDRATFDAIQAFLKARSRKILPTRVLSRPLLETGPIHCTRCGGTMTIRTGKDGRCRSYACLDMAVPMEKLDDLVAQHLEERLLQPERLQTSSP